MLSSYLNDVNAGADASRDYAAAPAFDADLSVIRSLGSMLPGPKPVTVNAIKVAASIRPRKFVIEDGDETPAVMPRTAFQIVYAAGTIMIDSGLDKETHDSFGGGDGDPYFPDQFNKLRQALNRASLIVLTHFHADHVAGVVSAPTLNELARKTMITTITADLLVNKPHRPHLRLDADQISQFIVFDFRRYFSVAPGVVLIKAPGHTPDSQMVYIQLLSGREILHSVDSAWIMDNILEVKGKAAPWVKEDTTAILAQLKWLKYLHDTEPNLTILVTHDDKLIAAVTNSGAVGAALAL